MADFQYSLGQRYQMVWGSLSSYLNQDTTDLSTVASQQYYYYPPATVGVDSATVLIGSVRYTLTPIYSQYTWNMLNAMQIQPTAIPQFIFPRKEDFGIWPIPTAVYTVEFNRFYRDRNLLVDDYTTGTISATFNDATITGSGGAAFTQAMVGRWFTVTDTSVPGQGYWYQVASVTDATHFEMLTPWISDNAAGATYRIGETPQFPEEGHAMMAHGATADFYVGLRDDPVKNTYWNNLFFTGDGNNNIRDMDSKNVIGGLIGMIQKYKDRERDNIVMRQPDVISPVYKIWASSIT